MSNNLCAAPLEDAFLEYPFCAETVPIDVGLARGLIAVGTSSILVLNRGSSPQQVLWLCDSDGDNLADSKSIVVEQNGLNHGLAVHNGYLYASSSTTVYRWPFQVDQDEGFAVGNQEIVVANMNADGQGGAPQGHTTRTLILDSQGLLYISIGSNRNVDADSFRSRIRRFNLSAPTTMPLEFVAGEVFADGLRNTVGLAFDRFGILWGVENGADRLIREDLGGDIHNDNPADELNRFPGELAGKHWGYPYCWSEFELGVGLGRGTRWAWPSFLDEGITDEYCRNQTIASDLSMQAHTAPLGIVFYNYRSNLSASCTGTFPAKMDGYAFIANHGSWNRDIPVGYSVVYVAMNDIGRVPTGEVAHDLLRHSGDGAKWNFRPVDVDFDDCGRLLVSSDGTSGVGAKVVRISYQVMNTTSNGSMSNITNVTDGSMPTSGGSTNNITNATNGSLPNPIDTTNCTDSMKSSAVESRLSPLVQLAVLLIALFLLKMNR